MFELWGLARLVAVGSWHIGAAHQKTHQWVSGAYVNRIALPSACLGSAPANESKILTCLWFLCIDVSEFPVVCVDSMERVFTASNVSRVLGGRGSLAAASHSVACLSCVIILAGCPSYELSFPKPWREGIPTASRMRF